MRALKLFNTETTINCAESALVKSLVQENRSQHFMKYLTVMTLWTSSQSKISLSMCLIVYSI